MKSVSTRDCAEFSVWMLTVSFPPTTARGSSVTPMSAATQPIMPSSVPSSNRAEDGQPNSEKICSSRCRYVQPVRNTSAVGPDSGVPARKAARLDHRRAVTSTSSSRNATVASSSA